MRTPAGRNYVLRVPGAANSVLSDEQLAAVLNWLVQSFDADALSSSVPLFTAVILVSNPPWLCPITTI